MTIAREQALWTVNGYLRKLFSTGYTGIREVLSVDEVTTRKLCLSNVSDEPLCRSWIAYCNHREDGSWLRNSTIVVIVKNAGKINYVASAGDKG